MSEKKRKFGSIEFCGKDISTAGMKFNMIATSGRGELLLLSVVAETQKIKQVRAIMCGGAKAVANASGVQTKKASDPDWYSNSPGRIFPTADGYQVYTHKLGYGQAHALFLTRMPGFMKVVTAESLWQELKSDRFTTPLLREWMPYIERELRAHERLEEAQTFGCNCGVLTATTQKLDEIIAEGLESGELLIPTSSGVSPA